MNKQPRWQFWVGVGLVALLPACGGGGGGSLGSGLPSPPPLPTPTPPVTTPWVLTWSDEFNGADGSAPDPAKWTYDLGGGGWGNNELESYTSRQENVQVKGGQLVITARSEHYTGSDGIARNYTSARLTTQGLFVQANGRFEARIKVPSGKGLWPAFWMLGQDYATKGWPDCGEIDIMEVVGQDPATVHGSLHGPGYYGANPLTGLKTLTGGSRLSDDFHVYAAEWEGTTLRFYLDDQLYATHTATEVPAGGKWVFDHPFFLILNVAVGGTWPGAPDGSTSWPQQMLVDYVRVYQRSPG